MRQPDWVFVAALGWVACGGGVPPAVATARPAVVRPPPASAPGSFWEETPTADVKLAPPKLERSESGSVEAQRAFADGVALAPRADRARSFGARYVALARQHVPFVVTMDVLFSIATRAVECALAEIDDGMVTSTLADALARTGDRLTAESRAARSDTAGAYALARGVVAVARKLLDPAVDVGPTTPEALAELAKVLGHAGPAPSPLLGRTLDYGAFDAQAGLAFGDARLPRFRAATWVGFAPLALAPEPPIDVAAARTETRAAALLARATNDAWTRLDELRTFASGAPDGPDPDAVAVTARAIGLDLRDEQALGDVVRIDKLRAALLRNAGATVEDTGGTMPTFRWLAPSAPPDARALALDASAPGELPSALAVALALGATDARPLLETKDARTLDAIARAMPDGPERRHASLHASMLDAIAAYLAPSSLDGPWSAREPFRRRKLEVALVAWTELRHADLPFARGHARDVLDEPAIAFDDARGAVEPQPEAIAKLVSVVRQAQRGLAAVGGLHQGGAAWAVLDRAARLLESALRIAEAQGAGPLPAPLARAVAELPSRIASLERRLGPAASPEVVATAADVASGRALEEATGEIEDAWLLVDVDGVASPFVGAAVPFYERAVKLRSNDAAFERQLAESPPAHPAWAPR